MVFDYFLKRNVANCLICALRPLIYMGFAITYIGKPKCSHAQKSGKPRIERNLFNTLLANVCNAILAFDIVLSIIYFQQSEGITKETYNFYSVMIPNYVNTLNYSVAFAMNNKTYIKYTNGLISLIDRRRFFWHRYYHRQSVYLLTTAFVYRISFSVCYKNIIAVLTDKASCCEVRTLVNLPLQKKLQFLQQFYLVTCSNYRKHLFAFGNVLFFGGQFVFTVFSMVQSYLFNANVLETENTDTSWFVVFWKILPRFLGHMFHDCDHSDIRYNGFESELSELT
ncbi:hypothetical protein NQ317_001545 [Molorchus minor]|uniref:Gustatory receptor n=1 Tax=Molorchus minor TaxID=1323400 RepID=A0ABQ9ISK1_9CUCU|nr:hypothetical protein NQ317_001545 [Molorchus minor]